MNDAEKKFVEAWKEFEDHAHPGELWLEGLASLVPPGDRSEFLRRWGSRLEPEDRAYILLIFAKAGHPEIAPFLDELDRSDEELARDIAGEARKALEDYLAS